MPRSDDGPARVSVWDVPTRLFHWLLVLLVTVSLITGNVGGVQGMDVHMLAGYVILALVVFRIGWGSSVVATRGSAILSPVQGG